ncbi:hypothetical protein N657DRAFT_131383 [Parathielavia appendiculata]|uniref:Uncharacterized protein n=1 Tax=Parathielavia appendiculata TaxID=2587402 RepID=A0AAN6Z119_9PEZI|nr:hypothetical protein N657DRAFT_131383 [Parathielavia appendiculata]
MIPRSPFQDRSSPQPTLSTQPSQCPHKLQSNIGPGCSMTSSKCSEHRPPGQGIEGDTNWSRVTPRTEGYPDVTLSPSWKHIDILASPGSRDPTRSRLPGVQAKIFLWMVPAGVFSDYAHVGGCFLGGSPKLRSLYEVFTAGSGSIRLDHRDRPT